MSPCATEEQVLLMTSHFGTDGGELQQCLRLRTTQTVLFAVGSLAGSAFTTIRQAKTLREGEEAATWLGTAQEPTTPVLLHWVITAKVQCNRDRTELLIQGEKERLTASLLQRMAEGFGQRPVRCVVAVDCTLHMTGCPSKKALQATLDSIWEGSQRFFASLTLFAVAERDSTSPPPPPSGAVGSVLPFPMASFEESGLDEDEVEEVQRSYYGPSLIRFTEVLYRCLLVWASRTEELTWDALAAMVNINLDAMYERNRSLRMPFVLDRLQLVISSSADAHQLRPRSALASLALRLNYTRCLSSDRPSQDEGRKFTPSPAPVLSEPPSKASGERGAGVAAKERTLDPTAPAFVPRRSPISSPVPATFPSTHEPPTVSRLHVTSPTPLKRSVQEFWGEPRSDVHRDNKTGLWDPQSEEDSRLAALKSFAMKSHPFVLHLGQHAAPQAGLPDGLSMCPQCEKSVSGAWGDHLLSSAHLERCGQPGPCSQFYCLLCRSSISGESNLCLHVEGNKHRRHTRGLAQSPPPNR